MAGEFEKEYNEEQSTAETIYTKCQNCGSNLTFDPETQCLKCEHCGTISDFEKSSAVSELLIEDAFNKAENWDEEADSYRCENCGAVVVLPRGETATICPYCETSHILKSEEMVGLKPNVVYPFTLTKEQGVERAKAWAKKQFFAPSKFKKSLNAENVRSIYEPCFTFDSQTFSTYHGRVGNRHTRVVGSGKNRRTETYIVWRNVSGTYSYNFDDVMINAGTTYSQKTLNKLLPFNYDTIKVYEKKFLTGYVARRHEKPITEAWDDAKSVMDAKIKQDVIARQHCDVVGYMNVSTTHSAVTYKYALLPVHLLHFRYAKKNYAVCVNGNTGKSTGKTPISPLRVLFTVLLGLAVVAGLFYLFHLLNL
ncbi:MAG: hypothetical protein J6R29_00400 [Clostridia bacterium]|nr:hypothetical protein [Clostridia bacterium]